MRGTITQGSFIGGDVMIPEVTVRTFVIEPGWIFPDSELTNN